MLSAGSPAPHFTRKPVFGRPVRIPDPERKRPLVLFFVRSLGSSSGRQALTAIQERYADFDRIGATVVAISESPWEIATDYIPRRLLLFPLISDAEGELFELFGVGTDRMMMGSARHLLMGGHRAALAAMAEGRGLSWRPDGRLGAQFVISPSGELAFAHYASSAFEPPQLDEVLECVRSC